ncbi:MlaE family lipid ABC transporter permease subunit [Undibacterium sp. CY18W]|uniref:MlaE family lipid ABC transporter permease subunit n=1 Tax=Undibacterium hunanense TaxID=2762292 RepID=A0ABR6ZXD9_9BURK|nr:MlaE family lipid ABC transporter permease subunit [Undibacterium hunanense]MBC3920525.1 MlaE family lipid ABC transporter permease subunit [Undibacterium hunanense]
MPHEIAPTLQFTHQQQPTAIVAGAWLVHALSGRATMHEISALLNKAAQQKDLHWDLSQISSLDHIGAQMLWRAWGKQRPRQLTVQSAHEGLFIRLEQVSRINIPGSAKPRLTRTMQLGAQMLGLLNHLHSFTALLGQLMLDIWRFIRHPLKGPWKELSANIYRTGAQALGITALVGILIGVVLSYLSAQQLRTFGGDLYIVNILGMSIIRELGPMLAAILVAGRSGSAITAQLGVMRVTEELDAMSVMGIPHGFRLIMPKVLALAIAMPLLVIWTDVMALAGGMISAQALLGMSPEFFIYKLPEAVPLLNYWIGLLKGVSFGMLIALIACHYGLRIEPNTESLGRGTTNSVVVAITVVIIADAVFAIIFSKTGY